MIVNYGLVLLLGEILGSLCDEYEDGCFLG